MTRPADPPANLRIQVEQRGDHTLVSLRGAVNVADCGHLRKELDALVDRQTPGIILDLSNCDFICSLGLGAMVSAHIRLRHYHGTIRLVKPPPGVTELLTVTRLNRLFDMYGTLAEALGASDSTKPR